VRPFRSDVSRPHLGARSRQHDAAIHPRPGLKDLVAGSGIAFNDRGLHELKGIPGEWRLYSVADEGSHSPVWRPAPISTSSSVRRSRIAQAQRIARAGPSKVAILDKRIPP
jgi:hypothetical protein